MVEGQAMKCTECQVRLCIEGVCDYCLAHMFEPRKEIPTMRPADTGERQVPDPIADAIAAAKQAARAAKERKR
jgi:hypothetical protein